MRVSIYWLLSSLISLMTSRPTSWRFRLKMPRYTRRISRLVYIVVGVLTSGAFLTYLNNYVFYKDCHQEGVNLELSGAERKNIVWITSKKKNKTVHMSRLFHVYAVFDRIGYQHGDGESDWDVLWSKDYPFSRLQENLINLKPHQRVNHFPGSGYVTNKLNLATSNMKGIPKAFEMPEDLEMFKKFAEMHPGWKWVQKRNKHRGVKVLSLQELDEVNEGTFIQQFIDDPLLIDGHRFDIGIYTTITSINPLRIYINNGEWAMRFCPEKYYPFDPLVRDKYVVGDDYLPIWKIASLQKYIRLQYTNRDTLFTYLKAHNYNAHQLEDDITDAIRWTYLSQERHLIKAASKYPSSRNFFEMVRFDFILDSDLNVYLMEVNMSPNLSSQHFPPLGPFFEQLTYGVLSLVGIARTVHNDLSQRNEGEVEMQVSIKDIQVNAAACSTAKCRDNCVLVECRLCGGCMTSDAKLTLKRAYLEHLNRHTWRRVMPKPFKVMEDPVQWDSSSDGFFSNLTRWNQDMFIWFHGKCLHDNTWCS